MNRDWSTRMLGVVLAVLLLGVVPVAAEIYRVAELNTEQIRALDRAKTVVLLPGGILEQHGPYLPSFTDGYINEWLTQELATSITSRPGWTALIFPTTPLGTGGANEIGRKYVFPGTYAVRSTTLRSVFMDLATELGEQGFRWVFIVHGHGAPNHNRVLDDVGDYFRDIYGGHMVHLLGLMPVFAAGGDRLSNEEKKEEGLSVHAGAIETATLLALRPALVDPGYRGAPPQTGDDWEGLVRRARAPNWKGYLGSPRLARVADGAHSNEVSAKTAIQYALRILDGLDERTIPRYGNSMRDSPENVKIDAAALAHEHQVEQQQNEWRKKRGLP